MTRPILFLPFEGSLAGQDTSGAMTATTSGTITYTAGAVNGTQAAQPQGTATIRFPTSYVSPAQGSVVVRYRRHTEITETNRYLLSLGDVSVTSFYVAVRFSETTMWVRHTEVATFQSTAAPALGTWQSVYVEWDTDSWGVNYGGGLLTSGRTGGFSPNPQNTSSLGGYTTATGFEALSDIDGLMIFAAPLTITEQDTVLDTAQAWSFDMLTATSRTLHPVLKIGSSHIGPMRVGERN